MIAQYEELVGRCKTLNELNFVQISYGNTITPSELLILRDAIASEGRANMAANPERRFTLAEARASERKWLDTMLRLHEAAGRPLQPFARTDLHRGITRFSAGGPTRDKLLLLSFTGSSQRMMMPNPTYLQNLDADAVDVVVFRDSTRQGYRNGVGGFGTTLAEFAAQLPEFLAFPAYRGVRVIGCSGGGMPALLAALQLGIDRVISVGPNSPLDPRWNTEVINVDETLLAYGRDGRQRHIVLVYGAQQERDRRAIDAVVERIDAEIVAVSHEGHEVKHVALLSLAERGLFAEFVAEQLVLRGAAKD